MRKLFSKAVAVVLAGAMTIGLSACGGGGSNGTSGGSSGESKGKKATIGVAFYQDSGLAVDATKAYLESIGGDLNTTFKYTVLTQTDEATNVQKVQELISSGVDGVICTMDLGTNSILEECEAAGVYLGGYICDYDTSYTQNYDKVFKSDYFVGTATDGQNPDDVTIGKTMLESLKEYNERNADAPLTHVSMAIFPEYAFPSQKTGADQFVQEVEAYNKDADVKITVDPLDEQTDVLQFSPVDSTYFSKHADSQAIISFAAGTAFVYPTMVSAGVDSKLKLFTTGFEGGEDENFGSNGKQTYQQCMVTAVESITYPLVLILNKINGKEFSDMPEDAERVSSSQFLVNSDEDMEIFKKTTYYTGKAENAMFTGKDVLNMTAYANENATYSDLKGLLSKLTIEDVK